MKTRKNEGALLGIILLTFLTGTLASVSGITSIFEYQTAQLLKGKDEGIVAAFGDFNADELGDIFLISNYSQQVSILIAQLNKPYLRKPIINITDSHVITSVVPADFNGDVQMDILLVTREMKNQNGPYTVRVYWGNRTTSSVERDPYTISEQFLDEPLVFDFNADMLPDLLMEPAGKPGVRKVFLSHRNKSFTETDFPKTGLHGNNTEDPFHVPQSHGFVDLNNDLAADIVLTTDEGYELWISVNGHYVYNSTRSYPDGLDPKKAIIGQSTFGDLDLDQRLDHIVPACLDKSCSQSAVYVFDVSANEWHQRMGPDSFVMNDKTWNFFPNSLSAYKDIVNQSFPAALRLGDYNLDGYVDGLAVLQTTSNGEKLQRVFLFDNIACGESDTCRGYNRTFSLHDSGEFTDSNKGVMLGTLYDIYEDGVPDIVMVVMSETDNKTPKIVLMKNDFAVDSCFFKITVVSGLCGDGCSDKSNPYGVNYPGPTIKYSTTMTDGKLIESTGTQMMQTSHFALQTPYQTFGLGPTPNFVDTMYVGIPNPEGEELRQKSWPFIIPNSQLVVIPHPTNEPDRWKLKLYVTPSQLIYFTGIALLGTCVFVACIVGVLHWREKREDMLEKKQDAQKFHFDAM